MRARRGSTLIVTLVVMFFFAILCGAVFGMAQMNVTYNVFFERRGVLEQATLTFAESLAEIVKANAASWWSGGNAALGSGDCTVSSIAGSPPMQFTYVISPDKNKVYKLFVKGEYAGPQANDNVVWGVSVDIRAASSADVWSKIVRM
jgi:hypothetical protein